jgi:type II secretory pathway component PulM
MMKAITPSIQAYGVKGMKSTPWQKTFKSVEALNAWVEKNGAEVYGIREIHPDEVTFR